MVGWGKKTDYAGIEYSSASRSWFGEDVLSGSSE